MKAEGIGVEKEGVFMDNFNILFVCLNFVSHFIPSFWTYDKHPQKKKTQNFKKKLSPKNI